MSDTNRSILLASRPVGVPEDSNFKLAEAPMPEAGDGEVLIRTTYLTVDPYMRGRMRDAKSYANPWPLDEAPVGGAVGIIEKSNHPDFSEGDNVTGSWGWTEHTVSSGAGLTKLDPDEAPVTTAIGILGMPGMTAYFGFLDICQPKEGEQVFVSGAAGAVGEVVGQIAKIKGCRVVGSAGTDEKVERLKSECGYNEAFNYKTDTEFRSVLRGYFPNGIDCYFDNVGGEMTDAAIINIAPMARISLCGAISQYNNERAEMGPRIMGQFIGMQTKIEGFIVTRFQDRFPEGRKQMAQWMKEGKLKYREDIVEGIENTPEAFMRMLRGENKGKQLVKIS